MLTPTVFGANVLVQMTGDLPCCVGGGRLYRKDIHAVQNGFWNAALVVGGGDPDDLAGVNGHFGKFVGEALRGVVLQQAVERPQRVVLRIGTGLVDFIHHDHRVGVLAIHQRLKHLAWLGAFPLRR